MPLFARSDPGPGVFNLWRVALSRHCGYEARAAHPGPPPLGSRVEYLGRDDPHSFLWHGRTPASSSTCRPSNPKTS